jgi:hypothetical protein
MDEQRNQKLEEEVELNRNIEVTSSTNLTTLTEMLSTP